MSPYLTPVPFLGFFSLLKVPRRQSYNDSAKPARGLADTHGSLHLISSKSKNQRAITFRSLDEAVLDELSIHLDILGYEYKRYTQSPGDGKQAQHILRIHKQTEVRRF